MSLAHFSMLIREFLNKDPDIVPEASPLTVLDSKSSVFVANNGNYTKDNRHISIIVNF